LFPEAVPLGALPKEKTSFSLSSEAKFKLATLKANLRREGHPATESALIEALINRAIIDDALIEAIETQSARRARKQAG
jgi:hypothetical protein